MAKNVIITLCFICTFCCVGVFGNDAERVAKIYNGEIGVKEATGRNDGHRVEEYLASAGLKKGNPWCAAFVTWVFKQAGIDAVVSGWSPAWFPESNTIYKKGAKENLTPGKADVFGVWFQNLGRIAHVGFIDDWEEGKFFITVEGNTKKDTDSREGDGVYRKRRLKAQSCYIVSRWI